MIRCFMDATLPEDSKCSKCCIYCDDKECDCYCPIAKEKKTEDAVFESDCIYAEEG